MNAAEGTPYVTEVSDLVVNEDLPEDRFSWAGDYDDRRRAEIEESEDRKAFDELPLPRS